MKRFQRSFSPPVITPPEQTFNVHAQLQRRLLLRSLVKHIHMISQTLILRLCAIPTTEGSPERAFTSLPFQLVSTLVDFRAKIRRITAVATRICPSSSSNVFKTLQLVRCRRNAPNLGIDC